jgi:hypothetical protein
VLSHAYVSAIHALLAVALKTWMPGTRPGMTKKKCGSETYPVGFCLSPKRESVTTVPISTKSSISFEYSITRASMACSSFLIRLPAVRAAQDIGATSGRM